MLLLFCQNSLLKQTFQNIIDPFKGLVIENEADFWEKLPDAKLIVIDENEKLYYKAKEKNLTQTFLFLGQKEPTEFEEVHFLKKPFSAFQLKQQLELLIAFVKRGLTLSFETVDFRFNGANRTLTHIQTQTEVRLTEKEAELIQYLFDNRHRIVPKDELLKQIFGYHKDVETHTLETHIYKLRQKMGAANETFLLTIDGGYQLQGILE